MRQPLAANTRRQMTAAGLSLPSPTGGWDAVSSLANMKEDRAPVLDNWFPDLDTVRIRRGYKTHAKVQGGTTVVETLMVYQGLTSATSKMFAAMSGGIYDVTSEATASVTATSGMSNNRWQWVNFTTSGGKYLWACNGANTPKHFDGSNWATPSISGVTSTDIVNVNAHKNRLWFCIKDSTQVAYLNTGSIAGTATPFELGGLCVKGGYINAMATWTKDGGAGEDDLAVFISSQGQAIVYQGTDPSSSNTWQLVGVFDLGAPIGRRCFTKVAGDVALVNIDGVVPLSKALVTDRGAIASIALSANINNAINTATRSYKSNFGWELTPYPKGPMALLNVPIAEGSTQHQYVVNTLSGAWCRFLGWNGNTFAVFNDSLYFAGNSGTVYHADFGGRDLTSDIDAQGQTAYNYYRSRGRLKEWGTARAVLTTDGTLRPSIGLSTDFRDNAIVGTPTTATTTVALYDTAIYDTDVYALEGRTVSDWTDVPGEGQCASIHFRCSTNTSAESEVKINGFDVTYALGGFM